MNAAATAKAGSLPSELAEWIDPARTALLIIDMQVDFAAPHGALGHAGVDLSSVPAALANAERLAAGARAAGVPVVFVGLQTRARLDSPAWSERSRRLGGAPDADAALCRAGEAGAEFFGPRPLPGDLVVHKLRYSGFFGASLDASLRALEVDTLVVAGLTTECCVDCTVRDAFHLDYHVFLAADACAAYEPDLHAGALKALALNCAILIGTDEATEAWRGSSDG